MKLTGQIRIWWAAIVQFIQNTFGLLDFVNLSYLITLVCLQKLFREFGGSVFGAEILINGHTAHSNNMI